ncbi:MAG: thioredoxin family protein [Mesonia sp.]|uniref:thioredoxin family protein n=1 Tax=Mesonia sp. TaxID=1960830 RepID=UPI00324221B4
MKTSETFQLIEESLKASYTYAEYVKLMEALLAEGKSTAPQQDENLTEYSKMNLRRMNRWEKTLKISTTAEAKIKAYEGKMIWLVISEGWCGDAAHSLPVIHQLADLNPNIEMRVVLRDQHEDLMNQFLTNGGKSIPKLIMYDVDQKEVIADWGPRPTTATQMVEDYKAKHGQVDIEFREQLQLWYNKDRGQNIIDDLLKLF